MPAQPLNDDQKADARRLELKFGEWQARMKREGLASSQYEAAAHLPFGQSALNQYVKGKIPLNMSALTAFSVFLGCRADEISPSLATKIEQLAAGINPAPAEPLSLEEVIADQAGGFDAEAEITDIVRQYSKLSDNEKQRFRLLLWAARDGVQPDINRAPGRGDRPPAHGDFLGGDSGLMDLDVTRDTHKKGAK